MNKYKNFEDFLREMHGDVYHGEEPLDELEWLKFGDEYAKVVREEEKEKAEMQKEYKVRINI